MKISLIVLTATSSNMCKKLSLIRDLKGNSIRCNMAVYGYVLALGSLQVLSSVLQWGESPSCVNTEVHLRP